MKFNAPGAGEGHREDNGELDHGNFTGFPRPQYTLPTVPTAGVTPSLERLMLLRPSELYM